MEETEGTAASGSHGRFALSARQGGGWGEPRVEPWWCGCLPLGPWLLFIGGKGDFITIEELYSQQGSLASLQW